MDYSSASKPWQSLSEPQQQRQQQTPEEMLRGVSASQANPFMASFQQQQQQQQQPSLRTSYSVPIINSITTAQVNAATLSVLQNASLLHGTHAAMNSALSKNNSGTSKLLSRAAVGMTGQGPTNSQFLNAQLSIMNNNHGSSNNTQQPIQDNANLQALLASLQGQQQQNGSGSSLTRSTSVPEAQHTGRFSEQQYQQQLYRSNDLFGKLSEEAAQDLLLGDTNEPFSDPFEPSMMDTSYSCAGERQEEVQSSGASAFGQEPSKLQQQQTHLCVDTSSRVSTSSPSFSPTSTTSGNKDPSFLLSVSSSTLGSDNRNQIDSTSSNDESDIAPEDSMLHNSCKLYPKTISVVESALRFDPDSIRKKLVLVCEQKNKRPASATSFWKQTQLESRKRPRRLSKYGYPINIALAHGADKEVTDLLIQAGPEVLSLPDGPDQVVSLHVAMQMVSARRNSQDKSSSTMPMAEAEAEKKKQERETIIRSVLKARPESASIKDRHSNYPLHVAARFDFSLSLVKSIYQAHPAALTARNFHGETPVEVAQRSSYAGEDVLNLLQRLAYHRAERENRKEVASFDKSHADLSPTESSSDENDRFVEV